MYVYTKHILLLLQSPRSPSAPHTHDEIIAGVGYSAEVCMYMSTVNVSVQQMTDCCTPQIFELKSLEFEVDAYLNIVLVLQKLCTG